MLLTPWCHCSAKLHPLGTGAAQVCCSFTPTRPTGSGGNRENRQADWCQKHLWWVVHNKRLQSQFTPKSPQQFCDASVNQWLKNTGDLVCFQPYIQCSGLGIISAGFYCETSMWRISFNIIKHVELKQTKCSYTWNACIVVCVFVCLFSKYTAMDVQKSFVWLLFSLAIKPLLGNVLLWEATEPFLHRGRFWCELGG